MEMFTYTKAAGVPQAIEAQSQQGARFIAGGTTLLDLMKLNVERPSQLIDINRLPLNQVEKLPDGRLRIGALVRNSDLAHDPAVESDYSVLSQALLSGASAQLRNMATTGGNLAATHSLHVFPQRRHGLQQAHTRLRLLRHRRRQPYPRHPRHQQRLHRHQPLRYERRPHRPRSHHSHPGRQRRARRSHRRLLPLPGNTPQRETVLEPGDLITSVTLPAPKAGSKQVYLKLRDRASYEFALSSAAIVAVVNGGKLDFVRVALGGVGTRPWRSLEAERVLHGKAADEKIFRQAAEAALRGAQPQSQNGFKVTLAKRCITHALTLATA